MSLMDGSPYCNEPLSRNDRCWNCGVHAHSMEECSACEVCRCSSCHNDSDCNDSFRHVSYDLEGVLAEGQPHETPAQGVPEAEVLAEGHAEVMDEVAGCGSGVVQQWQQARIGWL